MKTHRITKDQLDSENRYIGPVDLTGFRGSVEIEASLGNVIFTEIRLSLIHISEHQGRLGHRSRLGHRV